MINEQETLHPIANEQQPKRPTFLTVLIVLSAIYISFSLFGVGNALISGPVSEIELDEQLSELYALSADLKSNGVGEQFGQMVEIMIQNAIYTNNEAFYITYVLNFISLIIGAISLFLMYNLKKIGFHIYVIYSLLPIISMYITTPIELILTFSIVSSVLIAALFSLLYGINLKHMS